MASEIRVNKITNRSGLTTTTFVDTGVDVVGLVTASGYNVGTGLTARANYIGLTGDVSVTGVITATTFVGNLTGNPTGSGANLTNLSAANLTGTLPAIDGSNLTGIDATSIKNSGGNVKVQANNSGATLTGILTAVGGNSTEGAFISPTAVGVGTTTLTGRNAGVGTAPGTIVFNSSSGILQVYVADSDGWQDVSSAGGYQFQASGGTKNTSSRSGYAVHTFTGPGTFTVLG